MNSLILTYGGYYGSDAIGIDNLVYRTDFDTIPAIDPYYLKLFMQSTISNELDHKPFIDGDLMITFNRELYNLNFDVNSNGELVVIGDDADNYSIDIDGNLIYNYNQSGIGYMQIGSTFIVS
jgi:hypothetical protein